MRYKANTNYKIIAFCEHKPLASLKLTVEARANLVRSNLEERAEELDGRHLVILSFINSNLMVNTLPWSRLSCDFKQKNWRLGGQFPILEPGAPG